MCFHLASEKQILHSLRERAAKKLKYTDETLSEPSIRAIKSVERHSPYQQNRNSSYWFRIASSRMDKCSMVAGEKPKKTKVTYHGKEGSWYDFGNQYVF